MAEIEATESRKKFVRLAETRTQKAIDSILLIGNLSNPTNYTYQENDVDQIFRALNDAIKTSRNRFNTTGNAAKNGGFRLKTR